MSLTVYLVANVELQIVNGNLSIDLNIRTNPRSTSFGSIGKMYLISFYSYSLYIETNLKIFIKPGQSNSAKKSSSPLSKMTKENNINSMKDEANVEVIHNLNLDIPKGRYSAIAALRTEAKTGHIYVSKPIVCHKKKIMTWPKKTMT